ncbi:hypothetical protein RJ639_021368 [Escallonia herrerae]|uniref:Pentatricopeptide repeat-containing protein n=1 Tax=Escallonia herrerae TaxID=1293975 RepID=A0AA88V3F2_9ASTE|nr:hypothetical protein RJ639_021368 [Escallonia herrerae]
MDEKKYLVSWSACFAHNGMESQSVATFADMLRFGECPNEYCFAALIQTCCRPDYARTGMQLHNWVVKSILCLDVAVGCSLLDMYAKCVSDGSVDDVRKVF